MPDVEWDGEVIMVTVVTTRRLGEMTGGRCYLCGSPAVIDAWARSLQENGVGEKAIFFDKFS